MSSSRIIKSSCLGDYYVSEFSFATLDGQLDPKDMTPCENGFVPYAGLVGPGNTAFGDSPELEQTAGGFESEEAQLVAEELQPCITEEVMNARLEEAFERGYEEGQRQTERGLSNVFKALRDAIEEVYATREQIFRHSEEDLLKLSILVARKIIHREVSLDRGILSNVVAAALDHTSEHDELVVRLNPEDLKLVNSQKQISLSGLAENRLLSLKPDDAIPAGGCIVETRMGEIDARLEKQLDEIYTRLTEERAGLKESSLAPVDNREPYAHEES